MKNGDKHTRKSIGFTDERRSRGYKEGEQREAHIQIEPYVQNQKDPQGRRRLSSSLLPKITYPES